MTRINSIAHRTSSVDPEAVSSRAIRFVISDSSVGRDGLTLKTSGWQVDNYLKNPVVLFGHNAQDVASVIGRMSGITTRSDQLLGTVNFVPSEINPLGDTVFRMVRNGFLNATSVGFMVLEGTPSRSRPGGYDSTRQELLEVSIVPVPALPSALAEARSRGIDVAPLGQWIRRTGWDASEELRRARATKYVGLLRQGCPTKTAERLSGYR